MAYAINFIMSLFYSNLAVITIQELCCDPWEGHMKYFLNKLKGEYDSCLFDKKEVNYSAVSKQGGMHAAFQEVCISLATTAQVVYLALSFSHKGWIFLFSVVSQLHLKNWLENLKEECRGWFTTMIMMINFHHQDAARCVNLIYTSLPDARMFSKYITTQVAIIPFLNIFVHTVSKNLIFA